MLDLVSLKNVAGFQCLPQSLKTLDIKESLLNQGYRLRKCLALLHTKLQANYTVRKRASLLGLGNYSGKLKLSRACDAAAAEEREGRFSSFIGFELPP